MPTYAIGDVQGCYASLLALLSQINFVTERDHLIFLGDLVNRGPSSLEVLRFIQGLGEAATSVLGNHDLHLLGRAEGLRPAKHGDTLDGVLTAPDRDGILRWLTTLPLLLRRGSRLFVHAGLLPAWTPEAAADEARRLEGLLRSSVTRTSLLAKGAGGKALKALTTIRMCSLGGQLSDFKGAPSAAPAGCIPWFEHPGRRSQGTMVVFGHWSGLGVARGSDYSGLDSGCVWGGSLTALRLDDERLFSCPAQERSSAALI